MTMTMTEKCRKGVHDWIPDNIRVRSDGPGKKKRVLCRLCENDYKNNYNKRKASGVPRDLNMSRDNIQVRERRAAKKLGMSVSAYREMIGKAEGVAGRDDENPAKPWNYLTLKGAAQEAHLRLQEAVVKKGSNCSGNSGPWIDYADPNDATMGDEPSIYSQPTPTEAKMMCEGCPARKFCRAYAEAASAATVDQPESTRQPAWGVHDGRRWRKGKEY